jgi:hypothetical protein
MNNVSIPREVADAAEAGGVKHILLDDGIVKIKVYDALSHPKVKSMLAIVSRLRQAQEQPK